MINYYYNNPLASHFGIDKTKKLIIKKYYWSIFYCNIETYMNECNLCLASKTICHKLYRDLQLLPIVIHCWENLSMDFVIDFLMFIN